MLISSNSEKLKDKGLAIYLNFKAFTLNGL